VCSVNRGAHIEGVEGVRSIGEQLSVLEFSKKIIYRVCWDF